MKVTSESEQTHFLIGEISMSSNLSIKSYHHQIPNFVQTFLDISGNLTGWAD